MLMRWMGAVVCVLSVGCGSDQASGDGSGGFGGGAGGGQGGSGATGGASNGGGAGSSGASGGAGGASGGGSGGSGGVVDPTAPAWVSALTPGEWIPISGPNPAAGLSPTNHAEDIDPDADDGYSGNTGFSAVLEAWNGGAFAPGLGASGSLLCFGGGHNDYHSNEVIRFDVASREWSVLKLPYSEGTYSPPYENGLFPDGSPNPSHTYNQVEYHPGTNSLLIGRAQISDNPSNAPIIPMLDLTTLEWRHSPVNSPAHSHTGGWSAYDSMRDRLWLEGGGTGTTLTRFDPNANNGDGTFGTFENHSAILATVGNSAAYSPLHDAVIIVYESGEELWGFDPVDPGDGVQLTVGSPPEFGYYSSLAWSAKRSSFIYYPGTGSALYELTVSGDWKSGTWSFANLTTGGDDPGAPGRVLSKLRIAKYGDTEVVIMAYAVDAPVYAFVLP